MGTNSQFWKECAKQARVGASDFANDWQWFSGVPLVSAFGAYFVARRGSELSTGSPITDGVIAAATAFVITWIIAFFINLWRVVPDSYFSEKARADKAEERLKPKLRITFDMNDPNCVRRNVDIVGGRKADWYRLKAESTSDANIENCQARLIDIYRGTSPVFVGETPRLGFSQTDKPFEARVAAKIPSYIDFLVIRDDNHATMALATADGLASINVNETFSMPSDYIIRVGVSSSSGGTVIEKFLFQWSQDRSKGNIRWLNE